MAIDAVRGRHTVHPVPYGTDASTIAQGGVPAVVFYKTSPVTYVVARQLAKVKYLAMPNLLADEAVYPEFIQEKARPENLVREALDLLENAERRAAVQAKLDRIIASLGPAGAMAGGVPSSPRRNAPKSWTW